MMAEDLQALPPENIPNAEIEKFLKEKSPKIFEGLSNQKKNDIINAVKGRLSIRISNTHMHLILNMTMIYCECGKISENRDTGLCGSCSRAARKAETDALKVKKIYRIPKQSAKMKEDLKTYSKLRTWYLKDHPNCELMLIGCTKVAVEIHHIDSRGSNLNKIETWKSACRHCHTILHDKLSAKKARDLGLKK